MSRVGTAALSGVREYRRTPVLLALTVFLPVYVVGVFTYVVPDTPVALHLGDATVRASLTDAVAALMAPLAGALLAAIAGLFVVQSAADADARLVVAGYRPWEVVLARVGVLAGVGTLAAVVSLAVLLVAFTPEAVGWFAVAVLLAAVVYGALGVVVGSLFDRLPGVYLLLFGPMIDVFLFQNPLAADAPDYASLLPGHYPLSVAMDAAFVGDVATGDLALSLAYVAAVVVLAVAAFYRSLRA